MSPIKNNLKTKTLETKNFCHKDDNQFISLDNRFDVALVSELAHRERSAFKAIYGMSKWWARRSSSLFRALLLGLSMSADSDLTVEFYSDHQDNPDISSKIILDPFMGGATTVVEGLRLGYKVIGVDINPLSWFIAKTETTQVDLDELQLSFLRLENKVASRIHALYTTRCHSCNAEADIIHAFWVKQAYCSQPGCNEQISLFRDYVVGKRRGDVTVSYYVETCPNCGNQFDSEIDSPSIVQPPLFAITATIQTSALRQPDQRVSCPHCSCVFDSLSDKHVHRKKKLVIHALICPNCWSIFQSRCELSEKVECPTCAHLFGPLKGNTDNGEFECSNGHRSKIASVAVENGEPLPFRLYALEGFCPSCGSNPNRSLQPPLFGSDNRDNGEFSARHSFFKKPDQDDLNKFEEIAQNWADVKDKLPYPKSEIHDYEKTNRLIIHNYHYWHELFNARQLLSLAWLLDAILEEPDMALREALLAAFLGTLEHQNMLNIYYVPYAQSAGAFGRHDFHPKVMVCEGNVWGRQKGRGTFVAAYKGVLKGKEYLLRPYDANYSTGKRHNIFTNDAFQGRMATNFYELAHNLQKNILIRAQDSRDLSFIPDNSIDHVVTDPPYADSVQYAELADFFYVWLREALLRDYPDLFQDAETPKQSEIVENKSRKQSQSDFYSGLEAVLVECYRIMKPNGRLVFTFHHSQQRQWANLLHSLLSSGFELINVYPVHSEGTKSGNLVFYSNRNSVAHDIVHVCRKVSRTEKDDSQVMTWSQISSELKERVSKHVITILSAREHGQRIARADIQVMLWGECLAVYSRYYGNIVNGNGEKVSVETALNESVSIVDQILSENGLETPHR
jgi:putative DNA methylase